MRPSNLGAAARMAGGKPVLLRPPDSAVLVKHHVLPLTARRDLPDLLRHELGRITPFQSNELFWRWDSAANIGGKTRVTLTMVPMAALTAALAALESAGLKPDFVEVGPPDQPVLLPASGRPRARFRHALAWTVGGLAIVAVLLPVLLQERDLRATDDAIDGLQPAIKQIEALRHGMTASGATADAIRHETDRTGDLLQALAAVTDILPDDSFLTDLTLRERQLTISGRTASAPRLITLLSSSPAFRDPAFAAPVTRIEGASSDLFSIKTGIAR